MILTVRLSCKALRVGSSLLQLRARCDPDGQIVGWARRSRRNHFAVTTCESGAALRLGRRYGAYVTGPHLLPHLPGYIPPDVDMTVVKAQVGDGGVSAPAGTDIAALRQVVAEAGQDGIDLKIVVVETNPPIDTPLRDIATEVGTAYPGSTVLAVSPSYAGTFSPVFDRVTLEAGQDLAKTGDPVQSSMNFVAELQSPDFPWMPFTIVVVLGVAVAAVFTRMLQVRAKRAVADVPPAVPVD